VAPEVSLVMPAAGKAPSSNSPRPHRLGASRRCDNVPLGYHWQITDHLFKRTKLRAPANVCSSQPVQLQVVRIHTVQVREIEAEIKHVPFVDGCGHVFTESASHRKQTIFEPHVLTVLCSCGLCCLCFYAKLLSPSPQQIIDDAHAHTVLDPELETL
jgi:hypothetical protein